MLGLEERVPRNRNESYLLYTMMNSQNTIKSDSEYLVIHAYLTALLNLCDGCIGLQVK